MAAPEDASVTYEQLTDLEKEFEDAEVEIIRQQFNLTKPLFEKREKLATQIPNFWPLVLEQAPVDVDQYIAQTDSVVLLSSLTSFSVSRFELEDGGKGDPRSVSIKMEFSENEYFEDCVLEKKFWYRRTKDWSGLVSEPVPIKWKPGKDLTGGLLDMAVKVWNQEKANDSVNGNGVTKAKDFTPEQKELKKKIERTGSGASFFAWFGYQGRHVSAEENLLEIEKENEKRQAKAKGEAPTEEEEDAGMEEDEDDEEEEDDPLALDIFPTGDELAIAFSEDLWPNAIKYFTLAQEQDVLSDADFEDEENDEVPPSKKRKA